MEKAKLLHTSDVVRSIVEAHLEIEAITIHEFPTPPEFQDRFLPTNNDQELIVRAMELRSLTGMPFPEAIVATALLEGDPSNCFLEALGYHQSPCASYLLSRGDVLRDRLETIDARNRATRFVSLSSRVIIAGQNTLHIPQLDFHIPVSQRSIIIVENILQLISPTDGWILNSGKSYHFIGGSLIDEKSMLRFLSLALLYVPFTDKNWIAHQIIERTSALRLFENPRTGNGTPVVVKRLIRREKRASSTP